ncbi:hypothetical protein NQ318_009341, partial [Aromia moschata]
ELKSKEHKDNRKILCVGDFDVCCHVDCDIVNRQSFPNEFFGVSRILGQNNEANFAEFPWMLGILEDRIYRFVISDPKE